MFSWAPLCASQGQAVAAIGKDLVLWVLAERPSSFGIWGGQRSLLAEPAKKIESDPPELSLGVFSVMALRSCFREIQKTLVDAPFGWLSGG
jgi:hypothetical protein